MPYSLSGIPSPPAVQRPAPAPCPVVDPAPSASVIQALLWHANSKSNMKYGRGIMAGMWPIHTVAFVNSLPHDQQPQGTIYHTYTFGNYLIHQAPQYKV